MRAALPCAQPPSAASARRAQRRTAACPAAACPWFSESGPPSRPHDSYVDVVVTSVDWPAPGQSHAQLHLLCAAPGLAPDVRQLPLLLPAPLANATQVASESAALPQTLAAVEELHMKEVRGLVVSSWDAEGGSFLVRSLVGGEAQWLSGSAAEVLGLAVRLHQPLLLSRAALLAAHLVVLPALVDVAEGGERAALQSCLQALERCTREEVEIEEGWDARVDPLADWAPPLALLRALQASGALAPRDE